MIILIFVLCSLTASPNI